MKVLDTELIEPGQCVPDADCFNCGVGVGNYVHMHVRIDTFEPFTQAFCSEGCATQFMMNEGNYPEPAIFQVTFEVSEEAFSWLEGKVRANVFEGAD